MEVVIPLQQVVLMVVQVLRLVDLTFYEKILILPILQQDSAIVQQDIAMEDNDVVTMEIVLAKVLTVPVLQLPLVMVMLL